MERNRSQWHFIKDEDPLQYSVLLNDLYEEVHGYRLQYLDYYTEWIKPWGWCHKVILKREQLNYCMHLTGAEPPPDDVEQPSESTLRSHQAAYEAAKQGGSGKTYKRAQATLLETLKIHGLEGEYYYIVGGRRGPHRVSRKQSPWKCVVKGRPLQAREVEMPPWVINRSPGRSKSRQRRSGGPKTTLGGNCLHHCYKAQHPLLHPIWPPLPVMMGS